MIKRNHFSERRVTIISFKVAGLLTFLYGSTIVFQISVQLVGILVSLSGVCFTCGMVFVDKLNRRRRL